MMDITRKDLIIFYWTPGKVGGDPSDVIKLTDQTVATPPVSLFVANSLSFLCSDLVPRPNPYLFFRFVLTVIHGS